MIAKTAACRLSTAFFLLCGLLPTRKSKPMEVFSVLLDLG